MTPMASPSRSSSRGGPLSACNSEHSAIKRGTNPCTGVHFRAFCSRFMLLKCIISH